MENVTLLPHIGGVAVETHDGFERLCMENIEHVFIRKRSFDPRQQEIRRIEIELKVLFSF